MTTRDAATAGAKILGLYFLFNGIQALVLPVVNIVGTIVSTSGLDSQFQRLGRVQLYQSILTMGTNAVLELACAYLLIAKTQMCVGWLRLNEPDTEQQ